MARNTYEPWIPEEWGGPVITRVNQISAVESLARRVPMATDTKHTPRSAGVDVALVAKGGTYTEDTSVNDEILLSVYKFGKAIRIADEDLKDISYVDLISTKQMDWAKSYAKMIDNACIAVTAAANGTTIAFNSLYYQLTQTNSATGYTANANITKTGTGGVVTYAQASSVFGKIETSDYFDPTETVVMAHGAFKEKFRGVVDSQLRPIFQEGASDGIDRLFGAPITWSNALKTSGLDTPNPSGNPLMVVGNRDLLVLGIRSGPESFVAGADSGVGFLTDEAALKMRARRAFNIGHETGFAILEAG